MKTTVEIADNLFAEVRQLAQQENRSLRALIEEGLRLVIGARRSQRTGFRLRAASFNGQGLSPELAGAGWDQIRQQVYEGRGE